MMQHQQQQQIQNQSQGDTSSFHQLGPIPSPGLTTHTRVKISAPTPLSNNNTNKTIHNNNNQTPLHRNSHLVPYYCNTNTTNTNPRHVITVPNSPYYQQQQSSAYSSSASDRIEDRLNLAKLSLEYEELYDRYTLCLSQFQESANESQILRQDNLNLRLTIYELNKRLSILNRYISSELTNSLADDLNYLSIGPAGVGNEHSGNGSGNGCFPGGDGSVVDSPTSVIGNNSEGKNGSGERYEVSRRRSMEVAEGTTESEEVQGRVMLPKSISVRSNGYLKSKMSQAEQNRANRFRVGAAVPDGTQRVYVPGGNKEQDALEFDVYNQGMFKTELCNKWQDTGACPYGDQCQFAHGIRELRPVIRHPRYKTEVCRMVLMGDMCPYGHRCHFRHALTDEEKFMSRGVAA